VHGWSEAVAPIQSKALWTLAMCRCCSCLLLHLQLLEEQFSQ